MANDLQKHHFWPLNRPRKALPFCKGPGSTIPHVIDNIAIFRHIIKLSLLGLRESILIKNTLNFHTFYQKKTYFVTFHQKNTYFYHLFFKKTPIYVTQKPITFWGFGLLRSISIKFIFIIFIKISIKKHKILFIFTNF